MEEPIAGLGLNGHVAARLYAIAVDSSGNGHAVIDPDGRIMWSSPRLADITGHSPESLGEMCLDDLIDDGEDSLLPDRETVASGPLVIERRIRCADDSTVLVRLRFDTVPNDSAPLLSLWVTDLESEDDDEPADDLDGESMLYFSSAIADLQLSSTRDPLTGVDNRTTILEHLDDFVVHATGAALVVDIDDFRMINEGLSHEHGDFVLCTVAKRLAESVRGITKIGRLAGDEFLVLVSEVADVEDASAAASRLCHAIEQLRSDGLLPHRITVSIGAAIARPGMMADDLLRESEVALERARSTGPGRWKVFDQEMRQATMRHDAMGEELRIAVDTERIATWYQPIVDLITGRCVGWEALARWILLDGTARPAKDFIGFAESDGPISDLGRLVTRDAVRRTTRTPSDTKIAVNISPRQLDMAFLEDVDAAIEHYEADHSRLAIELRHVAITTLDARQHAVLEAALERGVHLHIDNILVDPSTVASLERHRISAVKLDRSVPAGLAAGKGSKALLEQVAEMASALRARDITTIAEGIEDEAQALQLRDAGWRCGQGFLFGPPAPLLAGQMPRPRDVLQVGAS